MNPDHDLIASLRREVLRVVGPLVPDPGRVALLDFPDHSNVGDSAIWLGELRCLETLGVRRLRYTCDRRSYDPGALDRGLGEGTILLHGGGNLGDDWPAYQRFRERVIRDFPERRIVQLPQSIHFRSGEALDRARRIFDAHAGLTLLVRERRSLEIARREFAAPSLLCPDMAFCLGALERPTDPRRDVVWLARTDHEAAERLSPPPGIEAVDWLDEPPSLAAALYRRLTRGSLGALGSRGRVAVQALQRFLAGRRLDRGRALLAAGRLVVTDRLHGHVLATLMGVRHAIVDTGYGKLRSSHETWMGPASLGRLCRTPEDLRRALDEAGVGPA